MSDCFLHVSPGETIAIKKDLSAANNLQIMLETADLLEELYFLIRPLAIDLIIGCRDQYGGFENSIKPASEGWYLHSSSPPSGVILETHLREPVISETPVLSPESILDWIKTACNQECPDLDSHQVSWQSMQISSVQARIPDEALLADKQMLLIESGKRQVNIPIENANGLWISGPISKPFWIESPLRATLVQDYGILTLTLHIHWSLWTKANSAGQDFIKATITKFLDKGWELAYLSPPFEPIDEHLQLPPQTP